MSFVSITFLIFYVVVLALRFSVGRDKLSLWYLYGLLTLSLVFYGWHVPAYLLLLLNCILSNYVAALLLQSVENHKLWGRRLILMITLTLNLGILGFFKYSEFGAELYGTLFGRVATSQQNLTMEFLLPIGISFYTFQAMSYTVDVYWDRQRAIANLGRFSLYVGFFPQLIAGPIVRAGEFFYQWSRPRHVRLQVFMWGMYLILRGLFLKIVVADNLGLVVDRYWHLASDPGTPDTLAFSLLVFFACQLYCDFMGYTDIARGIAYQLGFRLPINFNGPYIATSFSDFWHRWHISFSRWMRDYIYIPLGGNQIGRLRTYRNLVIVMLLSGMWHGAGLNFIAWGALHAIAMLVERVTGITRWAGQADRRRTLFLVSALIAFSWFFVVQLTWIFSMAFFRAADLSQALHILGNALPGLFQIVTQGVEFPDSKGVITAAWWFTLPVVALHIRILAAERLDLQSTLYERYLYAGAMIFAIVTLYAPDQRFIYFQF